LKEEIKKQKTRQRCIQIFIEENLDKLKIIKKQEQKLTARTVHSQIKIRITLSMKKFHLSIRRCFNNKSKK